MSKKPSKKVHFKTSLDPIIPGQTLAADCGKEIGSAKLVYAWDSLKMGKLEFPEELSSINLCEHCVFHCLNTPAVEISHIYSIVEDDKNDYGTAAA